MTIIRQEARNLLSPTQELANLANEIEAALPDACGHWDFCEWARPIRDEIARLGGEQT